MTCKSKSWFVGCFRFETHRTFYIFVRSLKEIKDPARGGSACQTSLGSCFYGRANTPAAPNEGRMDVSPLLHYPGRTLTIQNDMLLNDARPSKDLTTDISRNLNIRILHPMQRPASLSPWGGVDLLCWPTYQPLLTTCKN
jgi:hypothetical protein